MIQSILLAAVMTVPEVLTPGDPAKVILQLPLLSNAQNAYLHYGFNGWNIPLAGTGAGHDEIEGNINYYRHVPLTRTGKGTFETNIEVPKTARALHFAVCKDACSSEDWDNNHGRDYAATITFPYIGPVLTWDETTAPESGIVVSLITADSTPVWLKYGNKDDSKGTQIQDDANERHKFVLHGLKPDTKYWYQVGTGRQKSARYEFHTAKTRASITRFSFGVFGDAQDNGEMGSFEKTVAEILQHQSDLDFLIVTGDMPWNDTPGDWWTFFDKARPLLATKVVMPALGNHDTPTVYSNPDHSSFDLFFNLPMSPGAGRYYAFDFGPARFFALDSERMMDFAHPGGEQLKWLRSQLERRQSDLLASTAPLWTFTYWHVPPFNAGTRHWQQQFDFRTAVRVFVNIVDWDFSGHEHLGQRFKALQIDEQGVHIANGGYGTSPGSGTGFLLVPAAGAEPESTLVENSAANGNIRSLLEFPKDETALVTQPFNGFERVDIDGSAIRLRMYGASRTGQDGDKGFYVRDDMSYRK